MATSVKNCLVFVAVLGSSLSLCLAQAPSGQVIFAFDATTTPVYDVTGTYTISQDIVGTAGSTTPLTVYDMPIYEDSQGRLQGLGVIMVSVGNDYVAADYTAKGRISGGGNSPIRVTLNVHLTGQGVVAGLATPFNISIKYNLEVNPGSMVGTARGNAGFTKLQGGPINSDNVVVPLPPGVNGRWIAQMNIIPLNQLSGSGNFILSNGRTLPAGLSGTFSQNSGLSKVRLPGIFEGKGNSLNVQFVTGANRPDQANGKILGQTVRE